MVGNARSLSAFAFYKQAKKQLPVRAHSAPTGNCFSLTFHSMPCGRSYHLHYVASAPDKPSGLEAYIAESVQKALQAFPSYPSAHHHNTDDLLSFHIVGTGTVAHLLNLVRRCLNLAKLNPVTHMLDLEIFPRYIDQIIIFIIIY